MSCVGRIKDNPGMGSLYRSSTSFVFVSNSRAGHTATNVQLGQFGRKQEPMSGSYTGTTPSLARRGEGGNLLALHPR